MKGSSRPARDLTRSGHGVRSFRPPRRAGGAARGLVATAAAVRVSVEALELRCLLSASFDVTDLTELRADPQYVDVDGSDVAVAVLDSGIYARNPDLQPNVVAWYNAVSDPVDTPLAADSVNNAFDREGHGSHVSGIAASSDPAIGVAYAAKLVSVKVLADDGERQLGGNAIARGLQWVKLHAQELNVRVVNLSVGTAANIDAIGARLTRNEVTRAIRDLEKLGVTVVSASGNSYAQYAEPGAAFPAAVSTVSVANTWADAGGPDDLGGAFGGDGDRYYAIENSAAADRLAASSQRSTLANQVAAPGQGIYSTWNGFSGDGTDGDHKVVSGTSMAAPFVSGVVALMQDAARTFGGQYLSDPAQIRQILQDTADTVVDADVADNARYDTETTDSSPLPETGLSFKRVNARKAVLRVVKLVTAGTPGQVPDPGSALDTNAVRGRATIVPELNATRTFTYTGSIGADGQVTVADADIDLFRVNVQTRGSLTVKLDLPVDTGFPFDATIRLFDAAGTEVARADGDVVTFDYPTLTTDPDDPLATGLYYVGVSGQPNVDYDIVDGSGAQPGFTQGDYVLTVSLQNPDPNGVVQGAVDVDLSNPDESLVDPFSTSGRKVTAVRNVGLLGSDLPLVGSSARTRVDADVDMYRVIAPDDGKLRVDAQAKGKYGAQAADTYVKVYNEDLNLVGENDDASASNPDSRLTVTVTRGQTYYVAVTVFANRSFDARDPYASREPNSTPADRSYDLLLWADNGDTNGTVLTATDVTPGSPATGGRVGSDGANVGDGAAPSKDVDWFRVVAPAAGLLAFDLKAVDDFVPSLSVWELDPSGNQIVRIDDEARKQSALSVPVAQGQEVFVAITGRDNADFNWFAVASGAGGQTGAYTLAATVRPPEQARLLTNNSVRESTPTPVTLGQTVAASIGRDGDVVIGAADVDLYAYTPEADVTVRIRTAAGAEDDADTVLRLFDAAGREVASNDNATASGTSSRLAATLRRGQTYYIGVSGAGPGALSYDPLTGADADVGSTGRYSLLVQALPPGSASLTFTAKTPARYRDADGNAVVLKLSGPGTGSLEIDGANPDSFDLTIDGTGTDTVFSVKGRTTFGGVKVNGPLKAFKATGVVLAGDLNVEGTLGSLQIASADVGHRVIANFIESIRVGGDFGSSVVVSSDVGTFKAGNDLTGGTWEAAGGVRSLSAKDVLAGWVGRFAGNVGVVKVRTFAGTLTAGAVQTFAASGEVTGATIGATLGGIDVLSAGTLRNTTVRAAADLNRVVLGSAVGCTLFAGVADAVTALPTGGDAFATASGINSLSVRKGPFSDTKVAASRLGAVSLKAVQTDNAGGRFGLATTDLASLSIPKVRKWKAGQDKAVLQPIGDFVVDLLEPAAVEPTPGPDPVPG